MTTRRDIITSGLGLAAIIAAGKAPAALVRSMAAARDISFRGEKEYDPSDYWLLNKTFIRTDLNAIIDYTGHAILKEYIAIPDAHTVTYRYGYSDISGYDRLYGPLIEYGANKNPLSYWAPYYGGGSRNITQWDYPSQIKYIRFCADMRYLDDCWVRDNVTGLYLWKGRNVK